MNPYSSMNPLARQDSRPSFISWWSDSNPGLRGPTINLHAVAKPLMRRMYHRQVSEFIRKNRGSPLSRDALETYSSYFPWNYVFPGTKIAILSELTNRTESDVEARAVVDSPVFYYVAQMLWWPDIETRSASCALLGNLASHECTAPAILDLCEQLMSLVGEEDSELTQAAQEALCHMAGAQAIVASPVLDHVLELLESPRWAVRGRACDLVEKLAHHDSTLPAILKSKAFVMFVSLLVDEHPEVVQSAQNASSRIASKLEYASVVDAKTLDHVLDLLESSNPEVRGWACDRVGGLARHQSALPAIMGSRACARLVCLLFEEHPESVLSALFCIAQVLEGAQAIVKTPVLERALELLELPSPVVRMRTCDLVKGLARHASTVPAVLESEAWVRVVSLLSDPHPEVIRSARNASSCIARMLDDAPAIASKALDHILALLESSNPEVRRWACDRVGALAYKSILPAVLESKAFAQLLSLLHDERPEVVKSATQALSRIAWWLEGAQAIVEAKVLDNVSELIKSSYWSVRDGTCTLIEALVHHESILPAVLESKICGQLVVFLLREAATSNCLFFALYALHEISKWPVGAAALIDMPGMFGRLEKLRRSSGYGMQNVASLVLDDLVRARSKQQIP